MNHDSDTSERSRAAVVDAHTSGHNHTLILAADVDSSSRATAQALADDRARLLEQKLEVGVWVYIIHTYMYVRTHVYMYLCKYRATAEALSADRASMLGQKLEGGGYIFSCMQICWCIYIYVDTYTCKHTHAYIFIYT